MPDAAERTFTTSDTGGCSCSQILEARGLGDGLSKYGCSVGIILSWMDIIGNRGADADDGGESVAEVTAVDTSVSASSATSSLQEVDDDATILAPEIISVSQDTEQMVR